MPRTVCLAQHAKAAGRACKLEPNSACIGLFRGIANGMLQKAVWSKPAVQPPGLVGGLGPRCRGLHGKSLTGARAQKFRAAAVTILPRRAGGVKRAPRLTVRPSRSIGDRMGGRGRRIASQFPARRRCGRAGLRGGRCGGGAGLSCPCRGACGGQPALGGACASTPGRGRALPGAGQPWAARRNGAMRPALRELTTGPTTGAGLRRRARGTP